MGSTPTFPWGVRGPSVRCPAVPHCRLADMPQTPSPVSKKSRIQGALLGAFIGDALALGPHWYYDLDALRRDYGDWISDYTAPKPGRYHEGLPAGASSQAGFILALTTRSLVERGGYDEADFARGWTANCSRCWTARLWRGRVATPASRSARPGASAMPACRGGRWRDWRTTPRRRSGCWRSRCATRVSRRDWRNT